MPDYSIVLFGHYKADDNGGKRAQPGDIITFMPLGHKWTPREKSRFLIVNLLNGPEQDKMAALCEQYWNVNTYKEYAPESYDTFAVNLIAASKKILTADDCLKAYAEYLENVKMECQFPQNYITKRRMQVELADLERSGVDIDRMLDTKVEYDPRPVLTVTDFFDKMKKRKVEKADGLNLIQPRIL